MGIFLYNLLNHRKIVRQEIRLLLSGAFLQRRSPLWCKMHIARLPSGPLGIICRQFTLRLSLCGETRALLLTFNLIRSAGAEKLSRLFIMKTSEKS